MSGHTPGPWFAHGRYIGTKNHKSAIAECRDINGNWSDDAQSSGNASLIAAAPELLEAVKELLTSLVGEEFADDIPAVVQARAAIAKAEGRS